MILPSDDLHHPLALVPGNASSSAPHEGTHWWLLFRVQGALYGIEAAPVREILALPQISPLSEAAPFVIGVVDVQGSFVPVIDLSLRLGRSPGTLRLSVHDSLILLEWKDVRCGLVVNEVLRVCAISPQEEQQPPTPALAGEQPLFIRSIARVDEGLAMLLQTENLLRLETGLSPSQTQPSPAQPGSAQPPVLARGRWLLCSGSEPRGARLVRGTRGA